MTAVMIGTIGIIIFLAIILLGTPIAIGMTVVGVIGYAILTNSAAAFKMIQIDYFATFSSYNLSVIAMFTWMGFIAFYSGIGSRLYDFANKWIGGAPGGLAMATQLASALFGAVCGSNTATAATIGAIALPEMKKYGYNDSLSTASVASGGILGILIPPSMIAIVYGIATEQSIGKLFIAGIGGGILLMLLYMVAVYIWVKKDPSAAPKAQKFTRKEKLQALGGGLWETALIFIVSIVALGVGWFTPTEAGGFGSILMLAVALVRRNLTFKSFIQSLIDTGKTTAMVLLLIAGATVFGKFLAISKIPFAIANFASNLTLPSWCVFLVIVIVYLVAGCFIDALPLILLTIPIFYPVILNLGYDPIWFGVIIVLICGMGVITPPVGLNVYVIKGVAPDVPLEKIFKGIWPFLGAIVACIVILMMFPQIVLFLPNLMM